MVGWREEEERDGGRRMRRCVRGEGGEGGTKWGRRGGSGSGGGGEWGGWGGGVLFLFVGGVGGGEGKVKEDKDRVLTHRNDVNVRGEVERTEERRVGNECTPTGGRRCFPFLYNAKVVATDDETTHLLTNAAPSWQHSP